MFWKKGVSAKKGQEMKLDYKKAGVDIDKANLFVDAIKNDIKKSLRRGVLGLRIC